MEGRKDLVGLVLDASLLKVECANGDTAFNEVPAAAGAGQPVLAAM